MPRVRINLQKPTISQTRIDYLEGNHDTKSGQKQGQVFAFKSFGENILNQDQFKNCLEMTIPLPTELLEKNLSAEEWKYIGEKIVGNFGIIEKYGNDNVAFFIHFRGENSGETKNDNLHIHIDYVDRKLISENGTKKYQSNHRPFAINLATGKNIAKKDFREHLPHHFKVTKDSAKLDLSLVSEELFKEFQELTKNGTKRKYSEEELTKVEDLKKEIVNQAQVMSVGKLIYSARQESGFKTQKELQSDLKHKKDLGSDALNEICQEFELTKTIEKYGKYHSKSRKEEAAEEREERAKALFDVIRQFNIKKVITPTDTRRMLNVIGFEFNDGLEKWEYSDKEKFDERYLLTLSEVRQSIGTAPIEQQQEMTAMVEKLVEPPLLSAEDHFKASNKSTIESNIDM